MGGLCKNYGAIFNIHKGSIDAIRDAKGFLRVVSTLFQNTTLILWDQDAVEKFRQEKKKEWNCVKPIVAMPFSHCCSVETEFITARTVTHMLQKLIVSKRQ